MTTTTHYKIVAGELYRAFTTGERTSGQRFYALKAKAKRPDWIGKDFAADFHDAVDGTTDSNRRPPSDYIYELAHNMAAHLDDCNDAADAEDRMFDAAEGCVDIYTADKFKWACDMFNRWLIDEAAEEYDRPVKCSSYSQEIEHGIDRAQYLAADRMGRHLLACVMAEVERREASEMAGIIDDEYMVCTDCLMAIANGDTSGLDYHYSAEEATRRLNEIHAGMAAAGGSIVCGDSNRDEEFSPRDCDCCGCSLAGSRHHCMVLAFK